MSESSLRKASLIVGIILLAVAALLALKITVFDRQNAYAAACEEPIFIGYEEESESPVINVGNSQATVLGYNMVLYVTQEDAKPHYRNFRSYSINGEFEKYGARKSYGEKHLTKYVTAEELEGAKKFSEGTLVSTAYVGYQKGDGTAYYFGDEDGYVWFIESPVMSMYFAPDVPYTGNVAGYNMVLYVTQEKDSPYYRNFRSYSICGDFEKYGARPSYGEKHLTKYVTAEELSRAAIYYEGSFVGTKYEGFQKGSGCAFYFGDEDGYIWFIESAVPKNIATGHS